MTVRRRALHYRGFAGSPLLVLRGTNKVEAHIAAIVALIVAIWLPL
jgi:hypothetical protein